MLQGKCRTSISEWICKHQVWPEQQSWALHISIFRELSGRYRHTRLQGLVTFQEVSAERFRSSFMFEGKCFEQHLTLRRTSFAAPFGVTPAGFADQVSYEGHIHIAVQAS